MKYRVKPDIPCRETAIEKTIEASKAAFAAGEAEGALSFAEFLYQQSRYIRKFWWGLQAFLLLCAALLMHLSESDFLIRRTLGVAAPLFVVLVLPELWKNRNSDALEVESTTFFTIRQIYAARLTLFAGMDLLLITAFYLGASFFIKITILIKSTVLIEITVLIKFSSSVISAILESISSSIISAILESISSSVIWTVLALFASISNAIISAALETFSSFSSVVISSLKRTLLALFAISILHTTILRTISLDTISLTVFTTSFSVTFS